MNRINKYVNQLRIDDRSIRSNVNYVKPYQESYSQRILEEQKILQYRMMREEEISNAISGDGGDPTSTPTPNQTLPSYLLLFEDGSIATAENNDNIEINII
jgi:hypothetical protein